MTEPIFRHYPDKPYTTASGAVTRWKVDCDAFTEEDWNGLAFMAARLLPAFSSVEGVPTGGTPFAEALKPYCVNAGPLLIADDVYTSGGSIQRQRGNREAMGIVVFARGQLSHWVRALFQVNPWLAK